MLLSAMSITWPRKLTSIFAGVFLFFVFTLFILLLQSNHNVNQNQTLAGIFNRDSEKSIIDPNHLLIYPPVDRFYFRNLEHDHLASMESFDDGKSVNQNLLPAYLKLGEFQEYLHQRTLFRKDLEKLWKNVQEFNAKNSKTSCKGRMEVDKEKIRSFWSNRSGKEPNSWSKFYQGVSRCQLYGKNSESEFVVNQLLKDMTQMKFQHVETMPKGTQTKLKITFENGDQAVLKPQRFNRNYETGANHFYFSDFERHNAEIAAFHLDKILGYRSVFPTVGRLVDIRQLETYVTDSNFSRLFFISPGKNYCFVGICKYYCDTSHAVCGNPYYIEVSLQMLFTSHLYPISRIRSPYRRTYSKKRLQAEWQHDPEYCDNVVKKIPQINILSLVDLAIFDFLTGNQDRHHLEYFAAFPDFYLNIDNGRAFGRSTLDDFDILAPLSQCCEIRLKTLSTLTKFYFGPEKLSSALNESMAISDPLQPILADKHFLAIERRLELILDTVYECIFKKNEGKFENVVKK